MPSEDEQPSIAAITREEALRLLKSGSPHDRLRGARFFARNARTRDASVLNRFRSQETDTYVLRTLALAITRSDPQPLLNVGEADSAELIVEQNRRARIEAVEWIAGLLLHEIASPIGLIEEAASREVPNYRTSALRTRIEHLQKVFEGIEHLKNASSSPNIKSFDISSWLEGLVSEEQLAARLPIAYQGAKPCLVDADPRLLRFAVCNGVKNAVEAMEGYVGDEVHPLIITWGVSDSDSWIVIRDRGPGIAGPPQLAFEIGKSTKNGHSGFGLAIARQAMESMEGTVTLQPGRDTGAVYELRWPNR
jgi:signal transduction histidine kinase